MNVVIIEDEMLTAEDLADIIQEVSPRTKVVAILQSVAEAIQYFEQNKLPDLIFSDIQLGDGLCFDIFSSVNINIPVIFCTAFDEYAIKAFNANGVHYILKPFNQEKIREAFDKYHQLQKSFTTWSESFDTLMETLEQGKSGHQKKSKSILVYFKNSIIPVKLEDIALFYIKREVTHLYTFNNKTYTINQTLNELEEIEPQLFYRANRQCILNRNAIKEASNYLSRKISVELNVSFEETITISKEKIPAFLDWLKGEG